MNANNFNDKHSKAKHSRCSVQVRQPRASMDRLKRLLQEQPATTNSKDTNRPGSHVALVGKYEAGKSGIYM
jgi:tRNA U34 5-carboxymethylaminomethyl modifying GTPase MnmE/TrmE